MKEALLSLSPTELRTLAASLRSGRLCAPFSASSLGRYLSEPIAGPVSAHLQEMSDNGMNPAATAYSLDLLASARSETSSISDLIDLVLTGPPIAGAEHRDTSVVVSDLFRKAEETILIAGYAVYQGLKVFRALSERMVECPALNVRIFRSISETERVAQVLSSRRSKVKINERLFFRAREVK